MNDQTKMFALEATTPAQRPDKHNFVSLLCPNVAELSLF